MGNDPDMDGDRFKAGSQVLQASNLAPTYSIFLSVTASDILPFSSLGATSKQINCTYAKKR